jgi:large subunit ribosomal protein L28
MPRRCSVSGSKTSYGQNVSHSNRKTPRRFLPNLQRTTFLSEALGCRVGLRLSTRSLRTVRTHGGIDPFLLSTADTKLAPEALALKHRIQKAMGGKVKAPAKVSRARA